MNTKRLLKIIQELNSEVKLQNGGEIDPPKKKGWFQPEYSDAPIAKALRKARGQYKEKLDSVKTNNAEKLKQFKASQANNYLDYKEKASTVKTQVKDPNTGKKLTISVDAPGLKTIREKRELLKSLKQEAINYSDPTNTSKSNRNLEDIRLRSDNRINNLTRFENGGAASTGQAIGSLVGSAANMIVPGLGSILSPVLGMAGAAIGGGIDKQNGLRATYGKATTNTNPYGFELGGMIGGQEDLSYYKGRQHRHGGILVSGNGTPSYNPVAEVEGGETRWKVGNKAFIFSKKLKV